MGVGREHPGLTEQPDPAGRHRHLPAAGQAVDRGHPRVDEGGVGQEQVLEPTRPVEGDPGHEVPGLLDHPAPERAVPLRVEGGRAHRVRQALQAEPLGREGRELGPRPRVGEQPAGLALPALRGVERAGGGRVQQRLVRGRPPQEVRQRRRDLEPVERVLAGGDLHPDLRPVQEERRLQQDLQRQRDPVGEVVLGQGQPDQPVDLRPGQRPAPGAAAERPDPGADAGLLARRGRVAAQQARQIGDRRLGEALGGLAVPLDVHAGDQPGRGGVVERVVLRPPLDREAGGGRPVGRGRRPGAGLGERGVHPAVAVGDGGRVPGVGQPLAVDDELVGVVAVRHRPLGDVRAEGRVPAGLPAAGRGGRGPAVEAAGHHHAAVGAAGPGEGDDLAGIGLADPGDAGLVGPVAVGVDRAGRAATDRVRQQVGDRGVVLPAGEQPQLARRPGLGRHLLADPVLDRRHRRGRRAPATTGEPGRSPPHRTHAPPGRREA